MGILGKLFGESKEYPALDAANPAAGRIKAVSAQLESLAKQVADPLEVVPTGDAAFVFVGKPPKQFGIVWVKEGKIKNFKKVAEEKGLSPADFQMVSDKLRQAYEQSGTAERYSTTIANRKIVVTPSEMLGNEVKKIIQELAA